MWSSLQKGRGAALAGAMLLLGCGGGGEPPPNTPSTTAPAADIDERGSTDDTAILDILSGNPTEIRLDGKSIGKTPINGKKVTPGSHDVTFVFTEDDTPTLSVELGPGESRTVKLDPAPHIQEHEKEKGKEKEEPKPK